MRYFTSLPAGAQARLGAPPDARGSALLPGLPPSAKALKWGLWGAPGQLCGQPGTQAVPSPKPRIGPAGIPSYTGHIPSYNAPDVIFPALYYVRGVQEHAPVSLLRDNEMPVPAVDVYKFAGLAAPSGVGGTQASRLAQIAFRTRKIGGASQVRWPPSAPSWPNWVTRRDHGG